MLTTPTNPEIQKLYAWVDAHADEIVESLRGVLRIPSVEAEPDLTDPAHPAPFGRPVRQSLDYTLELCDRLGFRTKDVAGYAGHAEFGPDNAPYIGALGHLDVVPEGDAWNHPPYGADLVNGLIYARGSTDDKGPTYAALFGAKAVMDCGLPIQKRIRLIFGCNEESGFGCVHHYFEVAQEERPVLGFTPDSGFPLIYAEKGIVNLVLETSLVTNPDPDALTLVQARGGRRPNMVPDFAEALLAGSPDALLQAVAMLGRYWDKNVSFEVTESGLAVRAVGKSAHGSTPRYGDNAIARLARALLTLEMPAATAWLEWTAYSAESTGSYLGIAHTDDVAGPLTSNLGILETTDTTVRLTYNVRYPVTWTLDALKTALSPTLTQNGWTLAEAQDQPPLHVPLDQEPVATLLRVYREATGDDQSQPDTMGGGTYARATPHTVAYGASFPLSTLPYGPAHEPDECIAVETLLDATKIYATALYELAK